MTFSIFWSWLNYKVNTGRVATWWRRAPTTMNTLTSLFLTMSARGLTTSTQNITTKRVVIHLVRFRGIQLAHLAIFMTLKWSWSQATIRQQDRDRPMGRKEGNVKNLKKIKTGLVFHYKMFPLQYKCLLFRWFLIFHWLLNSLVGSFLRLNWNT